MFCSAAMDAAKASETTAGHGLRAVVSPGVGGAASVAMRAPLDNLGK